MMNDSAILNQIKDAVIDLTEQSCNQVEMVSPFKEDDISRVRFVARDPNGLVKGFIEEPYYNGSVCGYVAHTGSKEAETAVFYVKSKNDMGGTVVTIEDRFIPSKNSEHYERVLRVVDDLSGKGDTTINMLPSSGLNIEDVNYITRDQNGLIKGFQYCPQRSPKGIFVQERGAIFNVKGNVKGEYLAQIRSNGELREMGILKEDEEEDEEESVGLTAQELMTEILLSGDVIRMRKMPLDEMNDIYRIVKGAIPDENPMLTINSYGGGMIKTMDGDVIIVFDFIE